MRAGTILQVIGAVLQTGGLATVAWGIADTRQKFTDQLSLARRGWTRIQRFAERFKKKKPKDVVVGVGTSKLGLVGSRVRVTVSLGPWDDIPVEERVERLRERVESHDTTLNRVDERLDTEVKARSDADVAQARRVTELQEELSQAIRDAVAGGIRLESIGVSLFLTGIILGTWGNILN